VGEEAELDGFKRCKPVYWRAEDHGMKRGAEDVAFLLATKKGRLEDSAEPDELPLVVSRPDRVYGEVAVAYVVLRDDLSSQAAGVVAAIEAHCAKSLAKFKVPRAIHVVPELPKIGNNKIHRPALREMARTVEPVTRSA